MLELKSVYIDRTGDWARSGNDTGDFYLKVEADRALANKDRDIAELRKSISNLLKMDIDQVMDEVTQKTLIYSDKLVPVEYAMKLVAAIRHHKYKRCLAMARWCAAECVVNQNTYKKYFTHKSEFRIEHFRKWYFRLLKLAEKFKDK